MLIPLLLAAATAHPLDDAALSALLKKQTQEFSEAGQRGDGAVLDRYLDADVVFTNETGDMPTRAQMVGNPKDPPGPVPKDHTIEVTNWALKRQGSIATATFIDVLRQDFHGHQLVFKFQSTETWAERPGGWKMIASQTMVVPEDPPAVTLPGADLDAYVGTYRLGADYAVTIARSGDGLVASTAGGPSTPLKAEARDVLFVPGQPTGRRLFQRDASGKVTGYISRRSGNDLVMTKVS